MIASVSDKQSAHSFPVSVWIMSGYSRSCDAINNRFSIMSIIVFLRVFIDDFNVYWWRCSPLFNRLCSIFTDQLSGYSSSPTTWLICLPTVKPSFAKELCSFQSMLLNPKWTLRSGCGTWSTSSLSVLSLEGFTFITKSKQLSVKSQTWRQQPSLQMNPLKSSLLSRLPSNQDILRDEARDRIN